MVPYGKQWKWPLRKDEMFYEDRDIVMALKSPIRRGNRDIFEVPELTDLV